MEALLAEDSCAASASETAATPPASAGTSSRRIVPGRTMVVVSESRFDFVPCPDRLPLCHQPQYITSETVASISPLV